MARTMGQQSEPVEDKVHFFISNEQAMGNEVNEQFGLGLFKTLIKRTPQKFPIELGEEHPYDATITEGLYRKFGFLTALIERKVEAIWGKGFHVYSDNENAQTIIENWMKDVGFITIAKQWTREAFIKFAGYLELGGSLKEGIQGMKVLDAKYIFKKRDEKGIVVKYNQLIRNFPRDYKFDTPLTINKDFISIEPANVIEFSIHKTGDDAYGLGWIYPNLDVIDNLLGGMKNMHTLLRRKANSPYVITMGNIENNIWPSSSDVAAMGQKLEWLHNKHEWVIGPDIKIEALQFGNVSDKFRFPIETDLNFMFFGFQTAPTLMQQAATGLGSNLATTQKDVFIEVHIGAVQEELEKLIEEHIFKRVLLSNGFQDHVEIIWGQPDESEKRERIKLLQSLLFQISSLRLRVEMEREIARLLDIDENLVDEGEMEREREEERDQPIVRKQTFLPKITEWFKGKKKPQIRKIQEFVMPDDLYKDYPLIEWIGYNYRKYTKDIDEVVNRDSFANLAAINEDELAVGYLNTIRITKLKSAMKETFNKGLSIRILASTFVTRDIIPPLYEITNEGEKILRLSQETRSLIVARTETIRLSALGAIENYKNNDIMKVRFTAAISDRTCPICEGLNGEVYEIINIPEDSEIPIHVNCRCAWSPVVLA